MKKQSIFILLLIGLALLAQMGCKKEVSGCTDPLATNYNPNATIDNGTCSYILGCTDPAATNYNPNATLNDGSCIYQGKVSFWQSGTPVFDITDVTIGGFSQQISADYPGGVNNCGLTGCATFSLQVGTYTYSATEQGLFGDTWSGSVTITQNGCLLIQLL